MRSTAGEATEQGSSLEDASTAITGLLSVKEDTPSRVTQPEPVREPAEPQQAPAAPEPEADDAPEPVSEQAEPEEAEQPAAVPEQPQKYKVKVDNTEAEVTLEELLKGYSFSAHNTRKSQALAEDRRQFEEGIVRVARERDAQYADHLEKLSAAITATMPVEPDWEKLRTEVPPDVLASKLLDWQQTQKHLGSIRAEQETVKARQAEDADRGFRQHVLAEQAKLEDALPDMKDPEKARVLKTDLSEYAQSRGFTAEDLSKVTDHRLVLLLHDAMQHQKAKANAPKIANKIEKAMDTSPPGARTAATPRNALTVATTRLKKSGSVDDGAAAIRALLERKTG